MRVINSTNWPQNKLGEDADFNPTEEQLKNGTMFRPFA